MSATQIAVCTLLAVAIEISGAKWIVASVGPGTRNPRQKTLSQESLASRFAALLLEIEEAKRRMGLAPWGRMVVAYEAGQEGHWIARALRARGIEGEIIDPVSLQVDRSKRRVKTDRIDAKSLSYALLRYLSGEQAALRLIHQPSEEDEDAREWQRKRDQFCGEVCQRRDRIVKKLRTQGIDDGDWREKLRAGTLRTFSGAPLGEMLGRTLVMELDLLEACEKKLRELESLAANLEPKVTKDIRALSTLCGIGVVGARGLRLQLFWRQFKNRREVGSCTGLVGTPYASGTSEIDQGISKTGDPRVRALLVELAWLWLRYQPDSAISRWFHQRTQGAGKRIRRVMIVGVARRLAIALWRYLEHGLIPDGARLKHA